MEKIELTQSKFDEHFEIVDEQREMNVKYVVVSNVQDVSGNWWFIMTTNNFEIDVPVYELDNKRGSAIDNAYMFDTREEAEKWAVGDFEVIEVEA
ncbi:hypothetical protein J3T04_08850 [Staphylococcus aureus]|uniref:Uncharacterized protein n=1 Tax=Weissella diestrammenae TaxID=1162633 RepID=A0A7G9T4P0_9LACO|nr:MULTISPECIES: hypothetical protein [Bacilli]MCM0582772.1 hypothetical protein [Weissella diestrammenae]MDA5669381.1 hypothetical protein [Staphylococcus aureus]QNN75065.1 hypothetical protein H9L19_06725 [Weissella diestrammenae]